jgi:hypothetical protein
MAVAESGSHDEYREFLMGNEPTPVPERYCIPPELAEDVAVHFVQEGERSSRVTWEEV